MPATHTPKSGTPTPLILPFGCDISLSPPPLVTPVYSLFLTSSGVPTPISQSPSTGSEFCWTKCGDSKSERHTNGWGEHRRVLRQSRSGNSEPVIVSVEVLLLGRRESTEASSKNLIFPDDKFMMDVFLFNKSPWMRQFEVIHPDSRTSRKADGQVGSKRSGVIPLENRIQVGWVFLP